MTNTRNTPVEVLEAHYPLRVLSNRIAEGTGGTGQFHGGNGLERQHRATCRLPRFSSHGAARASAFRREWRQRGGVRQKLSPNS